MKHKKSALIAIIAIFVAFGAYASVTVIFPSVDPDGNPLQTSRLEQLLTKMENPDNLNAEKLDGAGAGDYLHKSIQCG